MLLSPHTHVALHYTRDEELRQATRYASDLSHTRRQVEEAPAVASIRRRLAEMHLAPAAR